MYARAEQVAAQPENRSPDDAPQGVEDEEPPRRQIVRPGKHCRKGAEQSDEASKEDD
jgi:hypothetical protein